MITYLLLLYGCIFGITNFTVKHVTLKSEKLPASFDGIRIVQISDAHLGSFFKPSSVEKGLALIEQQKPDIIIFSGDLVNSTAQESVDYIEMFKALHAPLGKFAVLGNHDMSDYRKIDIDRDSLNVNIGEIVRTLQKMNFIVLRDSSVSISRNNEHIVIAGTDNWGKPPFKPYGNIEKAMRNLNSDDFTLLISHDPSLWEEKGDSYKNIFLTFSGHTHGMQMGINTSSFRWTPSNLIYKYSTGLYQRDGQYLYVNPGFGFIGIPIRVGMNPEITVFTITKE